MVPGGSDDPSMTNSFLNLSAFLQKVAEAVSMLHDMEFDEKLAAIEFLKAAVSNSEADLSAARATSDFVKENSTTNNTTSTSLPVVEARKLAADNAGALPNTSEIYDGGPLSCSDLIHDIMEQSGLAVDAGAVHSVKTPDKLSQSPVQNPSIRQPTPGSSPGGIFPDCGEVNKPDVDVKMDCVDNWSAAETIKWLPKEYNMVLVVDDDFFEDEDDEIAERIPKNELPIAAEDVAPPEDAMVDLPPTDFPNPPDPPPPPPPPEECDTQVYVCFVCQKIFTVLDDLESHKLEHTKPHVCKYCTARYTRASHLIEHERKHTGEKPIPCPHCGEMMRTKLQVTLHIRKKQCPLIAQSRLNSKGEAKSATPAAAPENKSKHRSSKKKKVAATVGPVDPIPPSEVKVEPVVKREYVCDECKTTFSAKETFYRHILCHKPTKFNCPKCPAKFFLKSSLDAHLQAHTRKVRFGIDNN